MRATFLKGVVLGAVVSVASVAASAAVAGTGVGGVFNLGQTNTVNASTTLKGKTAGAQLTVSNTNAGAAAAGVDIEVKGARPPIVTNSHTLVKNLNADQLDGVDSSQLQHTVTGTCANGTTFTQIGATGDVGCSSSSVHAFSKTLTPGTYVYQTVAAGALLLTFGCEASPTWIDFENVSSASAPLDWMFSEGGTSSTVNASGQTLAPFGDLTFYPSGSRLEGQFILATDTTVVTVHLHFFHSPGAYCEYQGTAASAAIGAP